MQDPAFKTQLFRFVDVLPSLTSSSEIVGHLREYLGDRAVELHPALKGGLAVAGLAPAIVAGPVKANITAMARQFVVGETPAEVVAHVLRRAKEGIAVTVDLLGERVLTEAEAGAFARRNLDLLDQVAAALREHPEPCFSDLARGGPLPRLNVSVKASALMPELPPPDFDRAVATVTARVYPILRRARECGAFINLDMESFDQKALTLELFRRVLAESEFAGGPPVGIALQAYLRDTEGDLHDLVVWARRHGRRFTLRLVKGAYWDQEAVLAAQRGWPTPVWSQKAETDLCFERLTAALLANRDVIDPAFATHNIGPRQRHGRGRAQGHRPAGLRVPASLRHGRRPQGRAPKPRPPRPGILPRG